MSPAGDYGGTRLLLVGLLSALVERPARGRGQVADAAIVDDAGLLMQPAFLLAVWGEWRAVRGTSVVDGGAPFYSTYECADGR